MRSVVLVAAISVFSAEADAYAFDFRIGGELGLYHNDFGIDSFTVLTQVIDADLSIIDSLALTAGIPFVESFGGDEVRFRIGNPWVLAYFQANGDTLTFRLGGGLAIPAAQLDEDSFEGFVIYQFALAMYGVQSPWMYTPETFPIILPSLRFELDLGILSIDGAADLVLLVPFNSEDGQDFEVMLPLSAGAMVHVAFLGFGARIGAAILPTGTQFGTDDKIQLSLSPVITAMLGPIELEARLTMNLDDPFGFAFDDDGIFGFFLGVHAVF
jgi:hypothetical protein